MARRRRRAKEAVDQGSRILTRPAEVELSPTAAPRARRQARVTAAVADCLLDRYRANRVWGGDRFGSWGAAGQGENINPINKMRKISVAGALAVFARV